MATTISARNAAQKLGMVGVDENTTTTPQTYYTCPAGKVARVHGWGFCEGTGAAATVDLVIAGVDQAEWQATGGNVNQNEPQNMAEGARFDFDEVLAAGQIVTVTQNTGSNAEFHIHMIVEERPA